MGPSENLARLHHRFECIHPFIDGNDRVGHLALNLVLVRLGYPPVVILAKQREAYVRAQQRADEGDHGALGEMLTQAMLDNLNRFIVPNVAGPGFLVPLGSDELWHSSRNAVDQYATRRHQRRPRAT